MPLKAVLHIVTDQRIDLYAMGGKAAHGFFLELLKRHDPKTADMLHHTEPVKPFTLAVRAQTFRQGDKVSIPEHQLFRLRITVLSEQLEYAVFNAIMDSLSQNEPFVFSGVPVRIESMSDTGSVLERLSWNQLMKTNNFNSDVRLNFMTPTAFRRIDTQYLFPDPEYVFGSILRKWNAYAITKLDHLTREQFRRIRISRYSLNTRMLKFKGFKQLGFTGYVRYDLSNMDPHFCDCVNILADFASWAGVGAKTTMGMGVCESSTVRDR